MLLYFYNRLSLSDIYPFFTKLTQRFPTPKNTDTASHFHMRTQTSSDAESRPRNKIRINDKIRETNKVGDRPALETLSDKRYIVNTTERLQGCILQHTLRACHKGKPLMYKKGLLHRRERRNSEKYKIWGLLSFVIHRLSKATRRRGPPLDNTKLTRFSIIIDEFPSQSVQQNRMQT